MRVVGSPGMESKRERGREEKSAASHTTQVLPAGSVTASCTHPPLVHPSHVVYMH